MEHKSALFDFLFFVWAATEIWSAVLPILVTLDAFIALHHTPRIFHHIGSFLPFPSFS